MTYTLRATWKDGTGKEIGSKALFVNARIAACSAIGADPEIDHVEILLHGNVVGYYTREDVNP